MFPDKRQQLLTAHAAFICQVVQFSQNRDRQAEFDELLRTAEQHGWQNLVAAIREIAKGRRDEEVYLGLDDEDRIIAEAILKGLQDPSTLPDPNQQADAGMAAPGLAGMIHAAASGNAQALVIIGNMAEQMQKAGGDMALVAGRIRQLIDGERDPDVLCKGAGPRAEALITDILSELGKLASH
jgi:hypothetical protein